jgi:hypothetical protein
MPYQLEKGPGFSIPEAVLADRGLRLEALQRLRDRTIANPFDGMPTLDSSILDQGPWDEDARVWHQNRHWYGKTYDSTTKKWEAQQPFDLTNGPLTTGYWYNWYGDAEEIMRETFIRAIEVSLGIAHDAAAPTASPASAASPATARFWPIEIFWRCPAPWFEGWVTWRAEQGGQGHVTVHLHTPSHQGSALLLSPLRNPPPNPPDKYESPPVSVNSARGMWVITHHHAEVHNRYSPNSDPSDPGAWTYPDFGPLIQSHGPVTVVQPAEVDGGVLPNGRPYP